MKFRHGGLSGRLMPRRKLKENEVLPHHRVGHRACQFKKFGVSLNFTPVVLSEGRISLRVMTEVSDISAQNALSVPIPGTTNSVTVPAIRTRRADTTVEIPSGGSLAMAGMI